MKKIFIIILAFVSVYSYAQENSTIRINKKDTIGARNFSLNDENNDQLIKPNLIPQSPTAASLGMYGEIPIGAYSGTPEIIIPLYDITLGKSKIPIFLQYNSKGIRIQDEASWVGIGWSLNAGGVITRMVRGFDDFHNTSAQPYIQGYIESSELPPVEYDLTPLEEGYFPQENSSSFRIDTDPLYAYSLPASDPRTPNNVWEKLVQSYQGYLTPEDPEPDIFYYNIAGYSGKMIFPKQEGPIYIPVILNNDPLKIEYHTDNNVWNITTPEGILYTFGTNEKGYSTFLPGRSYSDEIL